MQKIAAMYTITGVHILTLIPTVYVLCGWPLTKPTLELHVPGIIFFRKGKMRKVRSDSEVSWNSGSNLDESDTGTSPDDSPDDSGPTSNSDSDFVSKTGKKAKLKRKRGKKSSSEESDSNKKKKRRRIKLMKNSSDEDSDEEEDEKKKKKKKKVINRQRCGVTFKKIS
jgi:hypothetical protein